MNAKSDTTISYIVIFCIILSFGYVALISSPKQIHTETSNTVVTDNHPTNNSNSDSSHTSSPAKTVRKRAPVPEVKDSRPVMPHEVSEYFDKVSKYADWTKEAADMYVKASEEAAADQSVISTTDWKVEAGSACSALIVGSDNFGNIHPVPRPVRKINKLCKRMASEMRHAAKNYIHGVDNLDGSLIRESAHNMENGKAIGLEMVDKINSLKASYRD